MGDADSSGGIDVNDVTESQKIAAEVTAPDRRSLFAADVNGDGEVNVLDATCVQKYLAELTGTGVTGSKFWVW